MKSLTTILLVSAVLVTMVIAGCGIVIDVPVGTTTGYIRICSRSNSIYGTLYVEGVNYGKIDGASVIGSMCLGIGPITLGRTYFVDVVDYDFGTGDYSTYITPRFDDQTIYLP